MSRRIARCEQCGESREMATTSECFACYRRRRRAEDNPIDLHNPGIRPEHRQILRAHSKLMAALSELRIGRSDVFAILDIVRPYIAPVAEFLAPGEREQADVHVHVEGEVPNVLRVFRHALNSGEELQGELVNEKTGS